MQFSEELIRPDELGEIGIDELEYDVERIKVWISPWSHDILQFNYVFVTKNSQDAKLPQQALGIDHVFKYITYLLDGDALASRDIHCFTHVSVASMPKVSCEAILAAHVLELEVGVGWNRRHD